MKEKFKKFLKYNYKLIIIYIILISLVVIKLDYQIYTPGGLLNLNNRIEINDSYKSKGSFNLTYVRGYKGNILFILASYIIPSWDLIPTKDIRIEGESEKESEERNKIYLNDVNKNAVIVAFKSLGLEVNINKKGINVLYIYKESDTDLKVGDVITNIDNVKVNDTNDLTNIVSSLKENQKINLKVLRNNKEYNRYAIIKNIEGKLLIGIAIQDEIDIYTKPEVKFKFKKNELGPSGGLMTTLKIYDMLTKEDITKGYKISGTGTIEEDGTIGEIAGIKYKLAGAYKNGSQIFICPTNNYKECEYEKNKNNYDIKLIEGDNFNNVLSKLKELPHYDK